MRPFKYIFGFVALFVVACLIGTFFALSRRQPPLAPFSTITTTPTPVPHASVDPSATPVPSAVPAPTIVPSESASWPSPDGKSTLIMSSVMESSGMKTYSFFVRTSTAPAEQQVFAVTVDPASKITIPFNSWSPDNRYFFIQQQSPDGTQFLAMKASGEPFRDGEDYLDINELFAEKNDEFAFKTVTGWASPTLLIINTTKDDGTAGPSFWLEVTTKSLIRLSTHFY